MDESDGRFDADIMDILDRELDMQRQTGHVPMTKVRSLAASSAVEKVEKQACSG